jgi:hypothetical protein
MISSTEPLQSIIEPTEHSDHPNQQSNQQSAIKNQQFHDHPVTAPVAAEETSRAYFASTPDV